MACPTAFPFPDCCETERLGRLRFLFSPASLTIRTTIYLRGAVSILSRAGYLAVPAPLRPMEGSPMAFGRTSLFALANLILLSTAFAESPTGDKQRKDLGAVPIKVRH